MVRDKHSVEDIQPKKIHIKEYIEKQLLQKNEIYLKNLICIQPRRYELEVPRITNDQIVY